MVSVCCIVEMQIFKLSLNNHGRIGRVFWKLGELNTYFKQAFPIVKIKLSIILERLRSLVHQINKQTLLQLGKFSLVDLPNITLSISVFTKFSWKNIYPPPLGFWTCSLPFAGETFIRSYMLSYVVCCQ